MAEQTKDDDVQALQDEIARLKAENAQLAAAESSGNARTRNGWALTLAVTAALVLAIAVPAVWMNRVVFDTETWVATVAPLAQDPAIQDAVADAASSAIIEKLDAQGRLESVLPTALVPFSPALANGINDFVRREATTLVRSDQFAQLWEELNRQGHKALLAAITGREGVVSVQAGVFTLDTGLLADKVKAALIDRGLEFVDKIPTGALSKEIVLYESPMLAAAGPVLEAISTAAYVIPLLGLLLAGGAIALAANRRKVVLWLGGGMVIAGVLPLQTLYFAQGMTAAKVQELANIDPAAAQNAYDIIFSGFVTMEQNFILLGAIIWVAALLAGPAKWAVAMRSGVTGGLGSAASHLELGAFGAWVAGHKRGLRVAGIIAGFAILFAMPAPRTVPQIVWLSVGVLVWFVVVEFFGGASPKAIQAAEETAAVQDGGGTGDAESEESEAAAEDSE